jgi:phospholipase/carboxylesterase
MNRIALADECVSETELSAVSKPLLGLSRPAIRREAPPAGLSYATFTPINYESGYAYPLLVWLHSRNSSERELQHIMPLVSMRNFVAVAPRANAACNGHANRFVWRQTEDDIEAADARVAECIAAAELRFNVHRSRVFLAGCGAGGTMAVRVAWNNPSRFAGVVSISGSLPGSASPLRRVNEARRLPCLLIAARHSRAYRSDRLCDDLRLLHTAGCTVAVRQYPGAEDLTNNMLADVNRWMMDLVCGTARGDS